MGEAIEATQKLYPGLLERRPNLLFMLRCRQFIEMVNGTDSEVRSGSTGMNSPCSLSSSGSSSPLHMKPSPKLSASPPPPHSHSRSPSVESNNTTNSALTNGVCDISANGLKIDAIEVEMDTSESVVSNGVASNGFCSNGTEPSLHDANMGR